MFVAMSIFSCNAQTSENQKTKNAISEDLQVYYFHNTKRCATCNAVENETKMALEMFFEDNMKAGTIEFNSLNLEEDEGKEMAQSLHVSGQTLLIVKGETHVNLTNEGFMNARTNPTKFHEIIKTQIDKLL
jgi:hypothetical protein